MTSMMVRVRDLAMRLAGGGRPVTILDRVDLDVAEGEVLAVTGPSGSGKSTLLGLVAGLDTPTTGSIHVAGREITGLDEAALARFRRDTIGYVFQSYHLIPTLTAAENVSVPLELGGLRDSRGRAAAMLAEVGLADRVDHYPAQLSGGEQQRVAFARAVARRPALVLADEPTGNLDSATGAQIIELLLRLNRERGTTIMLVTHDVALARCAGRIVSLRDGRVVGAASGTDRQVDGVGPGPVAADGCAAHGAAT
jgi:putative ABC transport system ATP-binding protein